MRAENLVWQELFYDIVNKTNKLFSNIKYFAIINVTNLRELHFRKVEPRKEPRFCVFEETSPFGS